MIVLGICYVPAPFEQPATEQERNLLQIKSNSVPCFGYHRDDTEVCSGCSVQGACRAHLVEHLIRIAERLDHEHRLNIEFEKLQQDLQSDDETRDQAILRLMEVVNDNKASMGVSGVIPCPTYTYCWVCDEVITPGTKSQWRPGKGPCHLTCTP